MSETPNTPTEETVTEETTQEVTQQPDQPQTKEPTRLSFRCEDDAKGYTVTELHTHLGTLIQQGFGDAPCKERTGDDTLKYVEAYDNGEYKRVSIVEAF